MNTRTVNKVPNTARVYASKYQCVKKIHARKFGPSGLKYGNTESKVLKETRFLKKPGKPNYHNPSSYRPISLTSVLGKCMERIIVTRLYSYVEHNNHIDAEQEGFRKFHSTSMALLRLVQNIYDGFNENESTVGVFIDMEKAFDSVWRKGLLHKLYNMGVKGRMWDCMVV